MSESQANHNLTNLLHNQYTELTNSPTDSQTDSPTDYLKWLNN